MSSIAISFKFLCDGKSYIISLPPLSIKSMRAGTAAVMPITTELAVPLAQIALLWGRFELAFNRFLAGLIQATKTENKRWQSNGFSGKRGRKKLFVELVRKFFICSPRISVSLAHLAEVAEELGNKRNVLLHGEIIGRYEIKRNGESEDIIAKFFATSWKTNPPTTIEFDQKSLEKLHTDLAYLAGEMESIIDPKPKSSLTLSLSLHDLCALQNLRSNIPDSPSIASSASDQNITVNLKEPAIFRW
ncbi:MAG: hypothetical protein WC670_12715 [Pseudolabrys sp.]|jgi:hypothetical protein